MWFDWSAAAGPLLPRRSGSGLLRSTLWPAQGRENAQTPHVVSDVHGHVLGFASNKLMVLTNNLPTSLSGAEMVCPTPTRTEDFVPLP